MAKPVHQRKRRDLSLLNYRQKAPILLDKAHSLDARIFTENMVGFEMHKVELLLTKHSYLGFSAWT